MALRERDRILVLRVERDGVAEARGWYRRQVVRSVPAAIRHVAGALGEAWRTERETERMVRG